MKVETNTVIEVLSQKYVLLLKENAFLTAKIIELEKREKDDTNVNDLDGETVIK